MRVGAPLLDRLVNLAGEVSITRSRVEAGVGQIKSSLSDLTENLERLRGQLRDIEIQGETQMASRLEAAKAAAQTFDPLEFDRFTRFQEITRMMAEAVNDVATVQRTLQRSLETTAQFRQRINRAAEAGEEGEVGAAAGADNWVLGTVRDRGSIHSDIWRGNAAELASRDAIGVFPVSGWWKEKPGLQRWERSARYSLLVSIRAPEAEIDLYTPIANQLAVEVPAG